MVKKFVPLRIYMYIIFYEFIYILFFNYVNIPVAQFYVLLPNEPSILNIHYLEHLKPTLTT